MTSPSQQEAPVLSYHVWILAATTHTEHAILHAYTHTHAWPHMTCDHDMCCLSSRPRTNPSWRHAPCCHQLSPLGYIHSMCTWLQHSIIYYVHHSLYVPLTAPYIHHTDGWNCVMNACLWRMLSKVSHETC